MYKFTKDVTEENLNNKSAMYSIRIIFHAAMVTSYNTKVPVF